METIAHALASLGTGVQILLVLCLTWFMTLTALNRRAAVNIACFLYDLLHIKKKKPIQTRSPRKRTARHKKIENTRENREHAA
jgi:hypothetical protein